MAAPKTKKKPQPLPMPIEMVLHSKHLICAAGAVHRTILTVTCHFWASGAPASGLDDATACQIAKIASGQWSAIKTPVMAALADLLPMLAREHAIRLDAKNRMTAAIRAAGEKGRATAQANRAQRAAASTIIAINKNRTDQSTKTIKPEPPPLRTPQTAREYTNHAAPLKPAELAQITKQNQQVNQTEKENARFVDE